MTPPGHEAEGLIDTNLFIHAHTTDSASDECREFLRALEAGTVRARLEPLILHELSSDADCGDFAARWQCCWSMTNTDVIWSLKTKFRIRFDHPPIGRPAAAMPACD